MVVWAGLKVEGEWGAFEEETGGVSGEEASVERVVVEEQSGLVWWCVVVSRGERESEDGVGGG
jgi:hypothetical protein